MVIDDSFSRPRELLFCSQVDLSKNCFLSGVGFVGPDVADWQLLKDRQRAFDGVTSCYVRTRTKSERRETSADTVQLQKKASEVDPFPPIDF